MKTVTLYKETLKNKSTGEIVHNFSVSKCSFETTIFAHLSDLEHLSWDEGAEYILPEEFEVVAERFDWYEKVVFVGSKDSIEINNVDGEPILNIPNHPVKLVRAQS
ncbi:hypothetical protein [Paenibacillus senegalimassiliensis]|uniref:hypothetical protein n=1 Tax=Paenibacillus senegalimassiliensis TaxID=1737426 RepID=UPI00073E8531|nr:hypothetical protein [Paenibacillus senegalimassiliensis]